MPIKAEKGAVAIDLVQWNGGALSAMTVPIWLKTIALHTPGDGTLHIQLPNGTQAARPTDWIIYTPDKAHSIDVLSNTIATSLYTTGSKVQKTTLQFDTFVWTGTYNFDALPWWGKLLFLQVPGDGPLHVPCWNGTFAAQIGDTIMRYADGSIDVISQGIMDAMYTDLQGFTVQASFTNSRTTQSFHPLGSQFTAGFVFAGKAT